MPKAKIIALSLVPTIGVVIFAIGNQILLQGLLQLKDYALATGLAVTGCIAAAILYLFPSLTAKKLGLRLPAFGSLKGLLIGLAFGVAVSLGSGLLYWQLEKPTGVQLSKVKEGLLRRGISNISAATMEEVGCRGGTAWLLTSTTGRMAGCLGGSIPFGVIHLVNKLVGNPVTLMHVLGCILAGWLLTLLYLRFGLVAGMACHWAWNVLCRGWCNAMGLTDVADFEGALTTCLVLVVASLVLWQLDKSYYAET